MAAIGYFLRKSFEKGNHYTLNCFGKMGSEFGIGFDAEA
jgi:hypothetical protein